MDSSPKTTEGQRLRCCQRPQCCQGITKENVKAEIKPLLKLSWPVVVHSVLAFLPTVISITFSGHLGSNELAAAALGQSIIHIGCKAFIMGYTTCCDTLFAQTFGSRNKKRVGVMLQRGILTTTLVMFMCSGVLINTQPILLLVGIDPEIARLAGMYVYIYLLGAPVDTLGLILTKYLLAQKYTIEVVVTILITVIVCVLFHYVFIHLLGYGLNGAIIAQVFSYYVLLVLLLGAIKWRNLHAATWGGWSRESLQEWGMTLRLGVSGAVMLCVEWWSFEVGFFVAGSLGEIAVGAHSVMFYLATLFWSIGGGLGIGGGIHIGNLLGANQPHRAKVSANIMLVIVALIGLTLCALILALQNYIGYIFTTDRETLDLLSEVVFILGFFEILDQFTGTSSGILRGIGRQSFGAAVNFICITCIGLPIYVVLVLVCDMGLVGLWCGLIIGFLLQNIAYFFFIFTVDWDKEALMALKRAAVLPQEDKEDETKSGDYHEFETLDSKTKGIQMVINHCNENQSSTELSSKERTYSTKAVQNEIESLTSGTECGFEEENICTDSVKTYSSENAKQEEKECQTSLTDLSCKERTYSTKAEQHEIENLTSETESNYTAEERTNSTLVNAEKNKLGNLTSETECCHKAGTSSCNGPQHIDSSKVNQSTDSNNMDKGSNIALETNDIIVYTSNPEPLSKVLIFPLCALIFCLLWVIAAIAVNLSFDSEKYVSIYINETVNANYTALNH